MRDGLVGWLKEGRGGEGRLVEGGEGMEGRGAWLKV